MQLTSRRRAAAAGIALRVIVAGPLGYAMASLITACLARLLPLPPVDATIAATLISFAAMAGMAILAFSVRSLMKLSLIVLLTGGALAAILALSLASGARL